MNVLLLGIALVLLIAVAVPGLWEALDDLFEDLW